MKMREQIYGQEAAGILRDIATYRALTKEQILRLYPKKEPVIKNLLTYLLHQGRICLSNGYYCTDPGQTDELDRGLLASVWVLLDFIDQVEYHSTGDYQAKIIFFARGEVYEIVYAEPGKEVLLNHLLAGTAESGSRYIFVVDDPEQISELQAPNTSGYCTVSPEGAIEYYQKE